MYIYTQHDMIVLTDYNELKSLLISTVHCTYNGAKIPRGFTVHILYTLHSVRAVTFRVLSFAICELEFNFCVYRLRRRTRLMKMLLMLQMAVLLLLLSHSWIADYKYVRR